MWIFSKFGFFSIVETKEKYHENEDFMIRARCEEHLKNLNNHCGINYRIIKTEDADYMYRIVVSKEDFHKIMLELEKSVDYTNFKDACFKYNPKDYDWHEALHSVWDIMAIFQNNKFFGKKKSFFF